uniref:CRAL-TRIO domain-containing protein n=1 Tax=Rhodnius prolixus TaxID=13249 RepID=T1I178_RHOPR
MLADELTEDGKDELLAECGYTRKQLDSDLEQFKEWLKLQHHLPASRLKEGVFLKMFLTGCKGSLEKAKRKLDAYYTCRSGSEIFDCRDPLDPNYVNIKSLTHLALAPKLVKHSRLVFLRLAEVDHEKFDFLSFVRNVVNRCDLTLRYEKHYGVSYDLLIDLKGVSISHLGKLSPSLLKDLVIYSTKTSPFRYKKMYLINVAEYLAITLDTVLIPFLPKKLKSRLHITANGFDEVSQLFDKSVLPKDYGGDQPSLKELNDYWRDLEIELRDWFMNELSERCDESKRIVPEDSTNPYFGVPGSLKKLIID